MAIYAQNLTFSRGAVAALTRPLEMVTDECSSVSAFAYTSAPGSAIASRFRGHGVALALLLLSICAGSDLATSARCVIGTAWVPPRGQPHGAGCVHRRSGHLRCRSSGSCAWITPSALAPSRSRLGVCLMDAVGTREQPHHRYVGEDEQMELAAEVVGAVTKAAVGVAVDRAAATVSDRRGGSTPPSARSSGAKRKLLAELVNKVVASLRSDGPAAQRVQRWDLAGGVDSRDRVAVPPSSISSEDSSAEGVMVNGYWFPSLAAAAEAPAGAGLDLAEATAEDAARARRERQRVMAHSRHAAEALPSRGFDLSCGAVLLSSPRFLDERVDKMENGVDEGAAGALPRWNRWVVRFLQGTGLMGRLQQAIRVSVPRMPRDVLLLVVGVAGSELAKREIATQVEALEEPVRGPAWALLNETYRNVEVLGTELVQSNWDFASLIANQLADWKRRGVGNSYQEALLKEVIALQTRAVLRPMTLPADELSLMVQLNATYRSIEESVGKLLPDQTKEQLSLLEGLVRKLDEKGIGELSFDEVYRALLLGAVPPTLVTDAVRLLAAGRPGEGGGAGFLSPEAEALFGKETGGEVTLASLAARLNDTQAVTRAMTYTALAAETEVIESIREVLDGLQANIRKSLLDVEAELAQAQAAPAESNALQEAASFANTAARSLVTFAIDCFNKASKVFDASFEALAEPSRRTLLKSSEMFPWESWNAVWNATYGGAQDGNGNGAANGRSLSRMTRPGGVRPVVASHAREHAVDRGDDAIDVSASPAMHVDAGDAPASTFIRGADAGGARHDRGRSLARRRTRLAAGGHTSPAAGPTGAAAGAMPGSAPSPGAPEPTGADGLVPEITTIGIGGGSGGDGGRRRGDGGGSVSNPWQWMFRARGRRVPDDRVSGGGRHGTRSAAPGGGGAEENAATDGDAFGHRDSGIAEADSPNLGTEASVWSETWSHTQTRPEGEEDSGGRSRAPGVVAGAADVSRARDAGRRR